MYTYVWYTYTHHIIKRIQKLVDISVLSTVRLQRLPVLHVFNVSDRLFLEQFYIYYSLYWLADMSGSHIRVCG